MDTVRRANRRLNDDNDVYMQRVFRTLFKEPRDRTRRAFQIINGEHSDLSFHAEGWNRIHDLRRANYRFYCDDDIRDRPGARWTLRDDPEEGWRPARYTPNRLRPLPAQEWEDRDNGIYMPLNSRGCQEDLIPMKTYGANGLARHRRGEAWPKRTITICQRQLQVPIQSLAHLDNDAALAQFIRHDAPTMAPHVDVNFGYQNTAPFAIDAFNIMTAQGILHEVRAM
ncbi:MAG: hypothetical protein Q9227_002023 [Pyrenula ochraceoflavens]